MAEILKRKSASKRVVRYTWQSVMLCQALSLGLSPLLPLAAMAQTPATPTTPTTSAPVTTPTVGGTTILPTDVVPLTDREAYKTPIGELLQLKIMQRLPSRLYFSSSIEVTGRNETNPFQFPTKRALMAQLPRPAIWRTLNYVQQNDLYSIIGQVARNNMVFRVLPNVSGGWTINPHTRLFTNYFMIRDQLAHNMRLNTVIHSYAIGLQHDKPIGAKGSVQFEFQGRELWQLHQQSVFDFLPGVTVSYILTPRMVVFVNALMQIRAKSVFLANSSMKEIDPFYTWGALYQKNGWTFSASSTFVQNFREPFHHNSTIPKNSYVIISDFEIARRILKQYPGLQAFCRAEPIWNFHSHNTPSLAGMDFRMFFGMRFAMAKPALTATLEQIREQLKQETEPTGPATKPSAFIEHEPEIAMNPQPIHGFLESSTLAETCELPENERPVIAEEESTEEDAANSLMAQESGSAGDGSESESSNNIASTGRTLDEVADSTVPGQSVPKELASQSAGEQPDVIDISKAQLDWKDLETAQTPVDAAADASLKSAVNQAAVQSNALALQERAQHLRNVSAEQQKEYQLAMAPAMSMPVPVRTVLPTPVSPSVNSKIPISVPAPVKRSIAAPQPSALLPSALAPSAVSSVPQAKPSTPLAFIYAPPKASLSSPNKVIQPLQKKDLPQTYSSFLPASEFKSDKKSIAPLPIISKSAVPNAVPAPVAAKLPAAAGVLPGAKNLIPDQISSAPKSAPARYATNKDGSIALSELKVEKLQGIPSLAQEAVTVKSFHQNTARENELLLASSKINALTAPAMSLNPIRPFNAATPVINKQATISLQSQNKPSLTPAKPTITAVAPKPVVEQVKVDIVNSMAISGLSDSDLGSPKIAMAVYDNWQSPVLDDPLIEDQSGRARLKPKAASSNIGDFAASSDPHKHKQADKKRTDMKLIPPFPAATKESKDGPLKDLKIPVLPVR